MSDIKVSIIMPSYNRYPLNLLSLRALEKQEFDLSTMEVIFIDDNSTDETSQLAQYQPAYPFKYIKNKTNLALAESRNAGIKKAKGSVLIFLDAEVIVTPQFVQSHYRNHVKNNKCVVTGGNVNRLYTYMYPDFNRNQINEMKSIHEIYVKKLLQQAKKGKKPIRLIADKRLDFHTMTSYSFPMEYFYMTQKISKRYPSFAWLGCVGLNHSVSKELAKAVGNYNGDFKGYGLEDYEFGYRLYKAGAEFVYDPNIVLYHQEHPYRQETRNIQEARNTVMFQTKHTELPVCILSLKYFNHKFDFMGKVLDEHSELCERFEHHSNFTYVLTRLLKQMLTQKVSDRPILNLVNAAEIKQDVLNKSKCERDEFANTGEFKNLISVYDYLIRA